VELKDFKDYMERGGEHHLANLSVDLVIIGLQGTKLKCLLLKMGDKWLLPGGHIGIDESVDEAVQRTLKDRTGLEQPHMKFLSVFGAKDRQFSNEVKEFAAKAGLDWSSDYWLNKRFVTLAYYSLVNIENTFPSVTHFEDFAWFDFDELPDMWMDHKTIVLASRNSLKNDIRQEHISFNLLPHQFTMPELHQLHEIILEEKLDRSRFQKKMLATGMFKRLPKRQNESPGRNPYQYSVKEDRFRE
jgi:ADP-ribose pyrophosphatase YjhB (NUDIX family)